MGIFRGIGGTGDSTTDTTVTTVTQKAAEAAASATAAASSATAAANSATSAATSYDNFDDRYLGDKTSDPTVDNDGDALLTGALYFNTTINKLKVYTGSAWILNLEEVADDTTPQLGGELDGQTNKITNIGDPTSAQDAATKSYVDSQVQSKDALSELSGDSDDITEGSTNLFLTTSERTKLSGIEANATADQTAAEIRALVESATDSNVFTDADHSKLNGIEASATADQTDAEIKTAYENNSDTNAFTDAEQTKLSGIETGATADQTASEILTAIKTVDGTGSGLDADLLDGNEASAFATSAQGSTADSALQNVSEDTTPQLGGDLDANGKNIKLGDFSNAPTANQLSFGASDDFTFNYNGSLNIASIISGGDLRLESGSTGSQSVTIETSSETMAEFNPNSSVDLYYDNSKKFETTTAGVDVTGTVTFDGGTTSADLAFGDNVKATFGALPDLQIYHTGTNSIINEVGAGNLVLSTNGTQVRIAHSTNAETMAEFNKDGSALLKYDGSDKLETTSTGIDVTGSIVSEIAINAQTGTTYTLVLGDQCQLVTLDNASAVTVTIPPNSSVAYPTGTKIDLLAKGAGQVTVAEGSGVTVNSSQSLKLRAQWSAASVIKLATDTWVLVGDLQAV